MNGGTDRDASYLERVYAGVLGKIIGVYLGRPFENWSYERIATELGEITDFLHRRFGLPVILTDDDIAGTFTFLRALSDHGHRADLSSAEIGRTWMNYIIEGRTVLWWGGVGTSTEHTVFEQMKRGIEPPASGSMALNGPTLAQQIGAQIFIDGWAMVAPGDPELAADLARRAAQVSHDGEAVVAAQVLAAMESLAFVEPSVERLLEVATSLIPPDSDIFRMIADIRDWCERDGDWRITRRRISERYGYDRYGGVCPVVPNHGLIIMALLHGRDSFRTALTIVNTSGWDTDCNSGNLGCLLGIKGGLRALESVSDWRAAVADRMYLSTADGGRAITDAAIEAIHVVNVRFGLERRPPIAPKNGARFHFELPGSVQGFRLDEDSATIGNAVLENVTGHSEAGARSLALRFGPSASPIPIRASTPTFIPPEARALPSYELVACPTLYSGQRVTGRISADGKNDGLVDCRLFLREYDERDALALVPGALVRLRPGQAADLSWLIPSMDNRPIAEIGLEVSSPTRGAGCVYLDFLAWHGAPRTTLARPTGGGMMWRRAWVDAVDRFEAEKPEVFHVRHESGTGLLIQGTADWVDYSAQVRVTPGDAQRVGLAVRVQGLRRYYALVLDRDNTASLIKAADDGRILASRQWNWTTGTTYRLTLAIEGGILRGWIDDALALETENPDDVLGGGGVALLCADGAMSHSGVSIEPRT